MFLQLYSQVQKPFVRPVFRSSPVRYRLTAKFRLASQAKQGISFKKAKWQRNSTEFPSLGQARMRPSPAPYAAAAAASALKLSVSIACVQGGTFATEAEAERAAVKFRNLVQFGKERAPPQNHFRRTASTAEFKRRQAEREERKTARHERLKQMDADELRRTVGHSIASKRADCIKALADALQQGKVYTLIRPASEAGETPVIGDGNEATQTQKYRVENIARGLKHYYELLQQKFYSILATGEAPDIGFHDLELAEQASGPHPYSARTLTEIYHPEFQRNGGFKHDGRGQYDREWIMNEEDMLIRFQKYMMYEKYLTIDKTEEFVNGPKFLGGKMKDEDGNTVLDDDGNELLEKDRLEKYGVKFPVCRDTVWHWMLRAGAQCTRDGNTQTYYTDNHNRPDVVEYREKDYTPHMLDIEDRMYAWLQLNATELAEIQEHHPGLTPRREINTDDGTVYEFHVDDSEAFIALRSELEYGGMLKADAVPVCKPARANWVCKEQHTYAACRCHLPVIGTGQDESIFHSNAMSVIVWKVNGKGQLRKKGQGEGRMVSAFVDSARGFGLPMNEDELAAVNASHTAHDPQAEPLTESPGLRYLKYGKMTTAAGTASGREGSWDNEKMVQQTVDYMDAAEVLYPGHQIHFQFDWSSGHSKRSDDGLCVGNMNWGYGGKQTALRDSKLTAGCIGPFPTTVTVHTADGPQTMDYGLQVGDTQSFVYGESAAGLPVLPPFNKLDAPRVDLCDADGKVTAHGFEGKCKGIAQILFETGWWNPDVKMLSKMPPKCKVTGLRRDNGQPLPPKDSIGDYLLAKRPDFAAEMSELQKVFRHQFTKQTKYANIRLSFSDLLWQHHITSSYQLLNLPDSAQPRLLCPMLFLFVRSFTHEGIF
eukprot:COSAG02_NODE_3799_length_6215_cov_11.385710_1_plen_882_part_00